jgi:hypothetical protein
MVWHEKWFDSVAIHQKLAARVGYACRAYSTVTDWIRKLRRGDDITQRASGSGRLPDDRIDVSITTALSHAPFHSVHSLSSAIKCPWSTVWRHLHCAGHVVRNLHFVPHTLSSAQKASRVEYAIELKQVLASAKHRSWRYFLTDDESWFCFSSDHDHMWVAEGEKPPTRTWQTAASPKRMLTVFWSPLGFCLVEILPKGARFDAQYFCSEISLRLWRIGHGIVMKIGSGVWYSISTMPLLT